MTPTVRVFAFISTILLFFLSILFLTNTKSTSSMTQVTINTTTIQAEIANTDEKRRQGLSGQPSLESKRGMLFIHEQASRHGYWMKEMQFPIDIIWIGQDKHVVDITKNATPTSYPATFQPGRPAQYVLEVNAGFIDQYSIQVGNLTRFGQL